MTDKICVFFSYLTSKNSPKSNKQSNKKPNNRISNNETQTINRTFWNQMQHLKQFSIKINRHIEKINSEEWLFSSKSNFKLFVDSINDYNPKHVSNNKQNIQMVNYDNGNNELEEKYYYEQGLCF